MPRRCHLHIPSASASPVCTSPVCMKHVKLEIGRCNFKRGCLEGAWWVGWAGVFGNLMSKDGDNNDRAKKLGLTVEEMGDVCLSGW